MRELGILYDGTIVDDEKITTQYFDITIDQVHGFRRSDNLYIIADDNILGLEAIDCEIL